MCFLQIDDFLSGCSPLTLSVGTGAHTMCVQLQLSQDVKRMQEDEEPQLTSDSPDSSSSRYFLSQSSSPPSHTLLPTQLTRTQNLLQLVQKCPSHELPIVCALFTLCSHASFPTSSIRLFRQSHQLHHGPSEPSSCFHRHRGQTRSEPSTEPQSPLFLSVAAFFCYRLM